MSKGVNSFSLSKGETSTTLSMPALKCVHIRPLHKLFRVRLSPKNSPQARFFNVLNTFCLFYVALNLLDAYGRHAYDAMQVGTDPIDKASC